MLDDFNLDDMAAEDTENVSLDAPTSETPTPTGTTEISIDRGAFSKLLQVLKLLENSCTDCDIFQGHVRQRSNDRQNMFDIDCSSILESCSLPLSVVKEKIGLLKTFEIDDTVQLSEDNSTIILKTTENNMEFMDPFSTMQFKLPIRNYLDNQWIPDEEFSQMVSLSDENLLFQYEIDNYLRKRIRDMCLNFRTDKLTCIMSESTATLSLGDQKQENSSSLKREIELNRPVERAETFDVVSLAFTLDVLSPVEFKCYRVASNRGLCKFELRNYGIPITLYTQVEIEPA